MSDYRLYIGNKHTGLKRRLAKFTFQRACLPVVLMLLFASYAAAQREPYTLPDKPGLAMKVAKPRGGGNANTLVVLLHGDISRGGLCTGIIRPANRRRCSADYMYRYVSQVAREGAGISAAAIIRPGYYDSKQNLSPGNAYGHGDNTTAENNAAIAAEIQRLKAAFNAKRVIAVGHSGGARAVGAIIARAPGLIDLAVLVSCPCNLKRWMRRPFRSESPSDFVDIIPMATKVVAITGSKDDNTFPALAIDYINDLRARGIDARYIEVPGAGHHAINPLWPTVKKVMFDKIPQRPEFSGEFDQLRELLQSGDRKAVKQWQSYFRGIGIYTGGVDGAYGPMTAAAVSKCGAMDECRGEQPTKPQQSGQSRSQEIQYNRSVNLFVDESQVIHGARASSCGGTPPTWSRLKTVLPDISVGTFSDAGIGKRRSGRCGGVVPARAIRFTATKKGRKQIKLFGDPISIVVN